MLVLRKEDTYSGRVVRTQGLIHVPAALVLVPNTAVAVNESAAVRNLCS